MAWVILHGFESFPSDGERIAMNTENVNLVVDEGEYSTIRYTNAEGEETTCSVDESFDEIFEMLEDGVVND